MANRNLKKERELARRNYVIDGLTDIDLLADRYNVHADTVKSWIDQGGWEKARLIGNTTIENIAMEHCIAIGEIQDRMREFRKEKKPVPDYLRKDLVFYQNALTQVKKNFDLRGSLSTWSSRYIEFVMTRPEITAKIPKNATTKEAFILMMQATLPDFLEWATV